MINKWNRLIHTKVLLSLLFLLLIQWRWAYEPNFYFWKFHIQLDKHFRTLTHLQYETHAYVYYNIGLTNDTTVHIHNSARVIWSRLSPQWSTGGVHLIAIVHKQTQHKVTSNKLQTKAALLYNFSHKAPWQMWRSALLPCVSGLWNYILLKKWGSLRNLKKIWHSNLRPGGHPCNNKIYGIPS